MSRPEYESLMRRALEELRELRPQVEAARLARSEPIAIVGIGCRFPGGGVDPESFWRSLRDGVDGTSDVPATRWNVDDYYNPDRYVPGTMCTRRAGVLDDLFGFDARFFDILPREAATMDPQQRLLLEVSYEALEYANIPVDRLYGSRTGVFVGISTFDCAVLQLSGDPAGIDAYVGTGSALSAASGRLSYTLGLTGPSIAIDTACSSSLVATHLACSSLRSRECELAIVGGVNALISPAPSVNFSQAGMLAPDGRCKTFDARADGYARGEGCGILVLKRLSDARADGDAILALIRGSATNQDGPSGGLTVPNGPAQESVIQQALAAAGLAPEHISYVEAHGTGTSLGDPIEVNALAAALCTQRTKDAPLLVGSVKTNIGHCEAAAGVAGIIKVVLSLVQGEIPPHLHFDQPNPHIDWDNLPIEVVTGLRKWPTGRPAIAGVSSFGFSGTNAHVILEEAPPQDAAAADPPASSHYLLPLSARTPGALLELAARFEQHLGVHAAQDLPAICRTAAVGRRHLDHRLAVVGASREALTAQLAAFRSRQAPEATAEHGGASRGVVFLFTGQGSQYPGMGRELYAQHPVFREALHRCDEILKGQLDESIVELMLGDHATAEGLERTEITQPALFSLEYALSELWRSWGIRPSAVAGHSVGEYVAALVAGVFDLEDGLRLIGARSRLMQQMPAGVMATVFCSEEIAAGAVRPRGETVAIAAVNAPEYVVISGAEADVTSVLEDLEQQGIGHARLKVSGAFHSPMVRDIVQDFRATADRIRYRPAELPLVSNVTGLALTAGTILDADYWCRQMTAPVRFAGSITTLVAGGHRLFLEIGPHPVLTAMARQTNDDASLVWASSLMRGRADAEQMLTALGDLYVAGVEVDWGQVHRWGDQRRVRLPAYPFQHRQYPIRVSPASSDSRSGPETPMAEVNDSSPVSRAAQPPRRASLVARLREMTQSLTGMDLGEIDAERNLFAMGFDSITLMRLRQGLTKEYGLSISMSDLGRLESLSMIAHFLDDNLPQDTPERSAPRPVPAAPLPAGAGSGVVPTSELGAIFAKQLDLMAKQIEILSRSDSSGTVPAVAGVFAAAPPPRAAAPPVSLPSFKRLGAAPPARVSDQQQQEIQALVDDYGRKTRRSKEMTQVYRPVFANIRNVAGFRPEWKELIYQIIVDHASGSRFTDIDGREYLDITMGFGVYLFGHRPDFVESAVRRALERGAPIGPMCGDAGEVARRIHEMTGVDRVAFFNTGSEAVMSAIRLARTVTARPKIVMFAGSYHGHTDNLLATGHGAETVPMIPGTPESMVQDTCVLPYGEDESLEFIEAHAREIAAVLVEPVQSRRPEFQPAEFLRRLREVTERTGIALIFDEVIFGFRVHAAGAQAWFDVKADMVTYGKTIGGGMPIGIVAGKSKYLNAVDGGMWRYGDDSVPPEENTFIAGTFNHHPLAMAAALAVLDQLDREGPDLHAQLNRRTAALASRLNAVFERERVPITVVHFASLFRFKLTGQWELFCYYLLARGVYIWEGRNCFLSTAHSDEDIEFLVQAVEASVADMIAAGASRVEPVTDTFPLTTAQLRMYALSQWPGGELAYHVPVAMVVEGPLDAARVRDTFRRLGRRHEALRTAFEMTGDGILQTVRHDCDLEVERVVIGTDDIDDVIARFMRPFDASRAPLVRIGLGELPGGRHLLLFDAQHIVFDGVSVSVFFGDFLQIYAGDEVPPPATSYRAYVEHEQAYLRSVDCARDEAYWLGLLAGGRPAVDLPMDRPRPARRSFAGLKTHRRVDQALTRELKVLARSRGTTLNVVLLAAHFILLHALTGADDIVVGCAVDGRPDEDSRSVVGMFVNTIVVRGMPASSKTVGQFLDELKQHTLEAQDHARYPYELLVEKIGGRRDMTRNPLFDTMFVYEQLETSTIVSGDLTFTGYDVRNRTATFDLTQDVQEADGGLKMSVEFNTDVFNAETVEGFIDRYIRILQAFAQGAEDVPLHQIDSLTPAERHLLLHTFNDTSRAVTVATVPQLIEAQSAIQPSAVALVHDETSLSYGELNDRANRLAHCLMASFGAGAERRVAIALERSFDMVVALLATLKTGAAYLPLDASYPEVRLAGMIADAKPVVVVTTAALRERLPAAAPVLVIDAPATVDALAQAPAHNPADDARVLAPESPAYVIYTSGSTGTPKGVVMEHRGLLNYVVWAAQTYTQGRSLAFPLFTTLSFDLTVTSIFVPLTTGGRIVVYPDDPAVPAVLRVIGDRAVDVVKLTPAHLAMISHLDLRDTGIQTLIVGGEDLKSDLCRRITERFEGHVEIFNEYGPTEAAVGCMTHRFDASRDRQTSVPIGVPAANARIYILDGLQQLVPIGTVGELYVAGAGLARGYLDRPGLTAERFLPDPYSAQPGARMYRTGDLTRWRADGTVEFLGRSDDQVKIRGFRIELGDVEAALLALADVSEVAVVAHRDSSDSTQLVAYVVAAGHATFDAAALRRGLGVLLPAYMVPSAFVLLDHLPLTRNGKLDRRALPPPDDGVVGTGSVYEAPRDDVESALADVWQSVLGCGRVSIHDNFFDLGGDSIKALQVVMRLQQRGYTIAAADLFACSAFADVVNRIGRATSRVPQTPVIGAVPLTPVQSWFAGAPPIDRHHFNQAVVLQSDRRMEEAALRAVLGEIQAHHDALRMRYHTQDGAFLQENAGLDMPVSLSTMDLRDEAGDVERAMAAHAERVQAALDLEHGPLVQAVVYRLPDADRLLLVIHHLVVDGVSWRILLEDLASGYRQAVAGEAITFPPKTESYQAWARSLRSMADRDVFADERTYWQAVTAGPVPAIPGVEGTDDLHGDAERLSRVMPEETADTLAVAGRAAGASVEALLLTALARSLRRVFAWDRSPITVEHHGRGASQADLDVARTVGWFTVLYPMALSLPKGDDLRAHLDYTQGVLRGVPHRGLGYGVLRHLTPATPLATSAEPRIVFNYLGHFDGTIPGFRLVREGARGWFSPRRPREHELEVEAALLEHGLEISLTFGGKRHDSRVMQALLAAFERETRALLEHVRSVEAAGVPPHCVSDVYPLSPLQEGMLLHGLVDDDASTFFTQIAFTIEGDLDVEVFRQSWASVMQRHDALRALFVHKGAERPLQVILRERELPFHYEDLRARPSAEQDERIVRFRERDRLAGFDLGRDVLMRVAALQTRERSFVAVLSVHHILMDGWCLAPLFAELATIYRALVRHQQPVLPDAAPYGSYIQWLQTVDLEASRIFWKDYLRGFSRPTGLPRVAGRTDGQALGRRTLSCDLSAEDTARLGRVAADRRVTLSSVLRAAWGVLLGKYTASDDVVFGVVVSGRPPDLPGVERMIGLFINTLPLRIRLDPDLGMVAFARKLQDEWQPLDPHQYLSLADAQSLSGLGADLLDHALVVQNYPVAEGLRQLQQELHGLFTISGVDIAQQANYPLMIEADPGEALGILLTYDRSVYDDRMMEDVKEQLLGILRTISVSPDATVGQVRKQLMTADERAERDAFAQSVRTVSQEF